MGWKLISNTGKGNLSNGSITTDPINTTSCNLIIVAISAYNDTITTHISDSEGNTWIPLTNYGTSASCIRMYFVSNPLTNSSHTFSVPSGHSGSSGFHSITVAAFSGAKTSSPYDANTGAVDSTQPSQAGSITPAESNELFISCICWYPAGTVSIDNSFNITNQINYVVGGAMGCAMAYKIKSDGLSENPGWSTTTSFTSAVTSLSSFKVDTSSVKIQKQMVGGMSSRMLGGLM